MTLCLAMQPMKNRAEYADDTTTGAWPDRKARGKAPHRRIQVGASRRQDTGILLVYSKSKNIFPNSIVI